MGAKTFKFDGKDLPVFYTLADVETLMNDSQNI